MIGVSYRSDSGRRYGNSRLLDKTGEANVYTVTSFDEEGQPKRVIKKFKTKGKKEAAFEEERDTLNRINQHNGGEGHSGIVRLLDSCQRDSFVVLEYMEGGNLEDVIDERGRGSFYVCEGVELIGYVARTLADIFESYGVVHRDVKPKNILLSDPSASRLKNVETERKENLGDMVQPGDIRLCDFSFSLKHNEDTGEYESKLHDLTQQGFFVGTLQGCAPEILAEVRGDEKSDVWSMGVMAYELLVKGGAFQEIQNTRDLFNKLIAFETPREIKRRLGGFEEVLYGMMQKYPEDRLTAREVQNLCEEFQEGLKQKRIRNPDKKSFFSLR